MGKTKDISAQPAYIITPLVDASTIALPMNGSVAYAVTIAGNRTLANPTNPAVGYVTLIVTQGSGGSHTLAFGQAYSFTNATPPTLSTAEGAVDELLFFCNGTTLSLLTVALNTARQVIAPSNLTATTDLTGEVDLAWTNNDPNQTGVRIQTFDGLSWSTLVDLGAAVTTYQDIEAPGTYTYRALAMLNSFLSPPSNTAIGVSN